MLFFHHFLTHFSIIVDMHHSLIWINVEWNNYLHFLKCWNHYQNDFPNKVLCFVFWCIDSIAHAQEEDPQVTKTTPRPSIMVFQQTIWWSLPKMISTSTSTAHSIKKWRLKESLLWEGLVLTNSPTSRLWTVSSSLMEKECSDVLILPQGRNISYQVSWMYTTAS